MADVDAEIIQALMQRPKRGGHLDVIDQERAALPPLAPQATPDLRGLPHALANRYFRAVYGRPLGGDGTLAGRLTAEGNSVMKNFSDAVPPGTGKIGQTITNVIGSAADAANGTPAGALIAAQMRALRTLSGR